MHRYRARAGQSLVEFALSAVGLITLLLGAVDFARAYMAQIAIKNAVAEAGYVAAQNPGGAAAIQQVVIDELPDFDPPLTAGDIDVSCGAGAGGRRRRWCGWSTSTACCSASWCPRRG